MSKGKYYNYGSMQRDAERRVYDMQLRAQRLLNGESPPAHHPDHDHGSFGGDHIPRRQNSISYPAAAYPGYSDYYDRLRMPSRPPEDRCEEKPRPKPPDDHCHDRSPACHEQHGDNMLMDTLGRMTNDPEQALLLLLLALLISCGADNELIFVLLYLIL